MTRTRCIQFPVSSSVNVGTASSVHHPPCYDKKNPFLQNGAHDPSLGDYLTSSYGVEGRCQCVTCRGGVIISDEEVGASMVPSGACGHRTETKRGACDTKITGPRDETVIWVCLFSSVHQVTTYLMMALRLARSRRWRFPSSASAERAVFCTGRLRETNAGHTMSARMPQNASLGRFSGRTPTSAHRPTPSASIT